MSNNITSFFETGEAGAEHAIDYGAATHSRASLLRRYLALFTGEVGRVWSSISCYSLVECTVHELMMQSYMELDLSHHLESVFVMFVRSNIYLIGWPFSFLIALIVPAQAAAKLYTGFDINFYIAHA